MNWGKRILTIAALSGVFASGMVGCSKGGDGNTSGNVSLNGTTSTSTDTVGGMPVTFTISTAGGYYGSSYGTVSVTMNGTQVQLTPMTMQSYYQQGPQQVQLQSYTGVQYAVLAAAICADQTQQNIYQPTCSQVAVITWIQPSTNSQMGGGYYGYAPQFNPQMPAMQVGILKDQTGNILAGIEKVGYAASVNGAAMSPALSTATDLTNWLIQNK